MDRSRFERISRLFEAACRLSEPERSAYLQRECGADNDLRRDVARMLRLDADDSGERDPLVGAGARMLGAIVDASEFDDPETARQHADEFVGSMIDQYRIVGVLGVGGMGTVYEAQQERPRRRVAIKVLSTGLPSRKMLQRFELEAQVLARLKHPAIAQIHDVGTFANNGRKQPYLVMELIDGKPLTHFARDKRLVARDRLTLFVQICDAVEHAHQKGIIHRDLKPANILVDPSGAPKILDFGIARVTDADVRLTTVHTLLGQLIGTVPYMSPEQITGRSEDVDLRADVYALGVILYELLTDRLPLPVHDRPIPEAARIITETDAPKLGSIARTWRGDVETIAAKALEKEPDRRYPTASALATDVRRYLANEPILARPAGTWYQLRKFTRRHRPVVAGVAVAFLALVLGIALTTAQLFRARRAESVAVLARAAAEDEARRARQISDFLKSSLALADPDIRGGREFTVRVMLDDAASRIRDVLGDDPPVEADVRMTIGGTYRNLGLFPEAEEQFCAALALRKKHAPADVRPIAETMDSLAQVLRTKGDLAAAEQLATEVLAIPESQLPADDKLRIAATNTLGRIRFTQGDLKKAEELYSRAVDARIAQFGERDREALVYMNNLGVTRQHLGRLNEAEEIHTRTLAMRRELLGDSHTVVAESLANLGSTLKAQKKLDEAEAALREALAIYRELYPEDHPRILSSVNNLGGVLLAKGDYEAAEPIAREMVELRRRVYGPEHPDVATAMHNLGVLLMSTDNYEEAELQLTAALAMRQRLLGDQNWRVAVAMTSLARLYKDTARFDDADLHADKALAILRPQLGEDHSNTRKVIQLKADILAARRE